MSHFIFFDAAAKGREDKKDGGEGKKDVVKAFLYLVGLLGGDNLLLTHGREDSDDHVHTVLDSILDLLGNLRLISGELDVLLGGGWREGGEKNETDMHCVCSNFRELRWKE
jgi:hypothetical protein